MATRAPVQPKPEKEPQPAGVEQGAVPGLVLASASPTRKTLLERAGIPLTSEAPVVDEEAVRRAFAADGRDAAALTSALAEQKARPIAARHPGAIVLGADQILDAAGRWFGKPADRAEARGQLEALQEGAHELVTAVCLVCDGKVLWHYVDRSRLVMRALTGEAIERYLDEVGEAAFASVGAYQLDGAGARLFSRTEGDYFAILGLPLLPVLEALRRYGAVSP